MPQSQQIKDQVETTTLNAGDWFALDNVSDLTRKISTTNLGTALASYGYWTRTTGAPNYLSPNTAGDYVVMGSGYINNDGAASQGIGFDANNNVYVAKTATSGTLLFGSALSSRTLTGTGLSLQLGQAFATLSFISPGTATVGTSAPDGTTGFALNQSMAHSSGNHTVFNDTGTTIATIDYRGYGAFGGSQTPAYGIEVHGNAQVSTALGGAGGILLFGDDGNEGVRTIQLSAATFSIGSFISTTAFNSTATQRLRSNANDGLSAWQFDATQAHTSGLHTKFTDTNSTQIAAIDFQGQISSEISASNGRFKFGTDNARFLDGAGTTATWGATFNTMTWSNTGTATITSGAADGTIGYTIGLTTTHTSGLHTRWFNGTQIASLNYNGWAAFGGAQTAQYGIEVHGNAQIAASAGGNSGYTYWGDDGSTPNRRFGLVNNIAQFGTAIQQLEFLYTGQIIFQSKATAAITPYYFNTSNVSHTSGNLLEVANVSVIKASIDYQGWGAFGGTHAAAAVVDADQSDTSGAVPVLKLDQADVSEEMIQFETTIGVGNAIEAVGAKTLTTTHFIKVTLPGGLTRYIPAGTIA